MPEEEPTTDPKKKTPVLRIVLIVVLVVLAVELYLDRTARQHATEAMETLAELLDTPQKAGTLPTAEVVQGEILSREPSSRDADGQWVYETYSWRAMFRSYTVYVVYSQFQGGETLAEVSLNVPPTGWQGGRSPVAVSGAVTCDAEAIANGTIRFIPIGDTGEQPKSARIVDGKYSISADLGMLAGQYKVSIIGNRQATPEEIVQMKAAMTEEPDEDDPVSEMSDSDFQVPFLPEKYNETTTLTAELTEGENTQDFTLEL